MLSLGVFKKSEHAIIPSFATEQSACFDLSACLLKCEKIVGYSMMNEKIELYCNTDYVEIPIDFRALIPTGLIFDIPKDHSIRVHPRSGLALKSGLIMQNCEGIIDSDYVEECMVMIRNDSLTRLTITHGMRIAQAELVPTLRYSFNQIDGKPDRKTDRNGGFGSTGVN